jgi:hypothetical protein
MDCSGTAPLRFHQWLPFGISTANGYVDCFRVSQGYSLAKRGSSFWTWTPYVQMWANIFAEIRAAQLEVGAIDMSNELDIMNFPAQARLIYDCPPGQACFDVLGAVRTAAAANGVDSWRVTFSTSEKRPIFQSPAAGANPATSYCASVYGDSALVILQSQLNGAFDGSTGFFGYPGPPTIADYRLHCGPNPIPGASSLLKRYDKPRVIDFHSYPCVELESTAKCDPNTTAEIVANKTFSALWDLMKRSGQTSATAVIGETHPNQGCDGYDVVNTSQSVSGLKNSSLYLTHRLNMIVRPWNNPSQQNPPDSSHAFPWSCYQAPWAIVPPYQFP